MRVPKFMSIPSLPEQLALNLAKTSHPNGRPFLRSSCNLEAVLQIESWPAWPGSILALTGPEGTGKTHLAQCWADRVGAVSLEAALACESRRPVLIDDADRWVADERLFHLINRAIEGESALLLVSRLAPREWETPIPDLRSRLNAIPQARLGLPDDVVMEAVLRTAFEDRFLTPSEDIYSYLLSRIERSIPRAITLVAALDVLALERGVAVSRVLARQFFEISLETSTLFDRELAAP